MADPAGYDRRTGEGVVLVEGDLDLAVTLPDGRHSAVTVTGDGTGELHVLLASPQVAGAGLDRRDLGRAADMLAAAGVTARISGPHGPIGRAGAGVSSRTGTLLTGSSRVAMRARRDGLSAVRGMVPRVIEVGLAVGVVGLALWALGSQVAS